MIQKVCLSFIGHLFQEVPLGVWEFRSKSSISTNAEDESFGGCKGYMFALEVTEELQEWPERGNRQRKWVRSSKYNNKYKIE